MGMERGRNLLSAIPYLISKRNTKEKKKIEARS
jgi:hypothetical protein